MNRTVRITVNGREHMAEEGMSLAAVLLNADVARFRVSSDGQGRGPVCGMGICFECRVTVDATRHVRACLVSVTDGMQVNTDS